MKSKRILTLILLLHIFLLAGCQKNTNEIIPEEDLVQDAEFPKPTETVAVNVEKIELPEEIQKNKIEEHSFEVKLNEWGDVTFVSCKPDTEEGGNAFADMSFYLIDGEKVLYRFPDVEENNIRMTGLWYDMSFAYFEDINEDGREDAVLGIWYISGAGPQGMIPYTEVRIYEGVADSFVYNKNLCEKFTNLEYDITADDVKKLIQYVKNDTEADINKALQYFEEIK